MNRSEGGKDRKLVLVGGGKPQMRKRRPRDWSKAKERDFLSALADTCNVTLAAEDAGVSVAGAYRRRKENGAFRAGWREALVVAYLRLELVLLDRAFNGTERVITRRDGSEERMREYSNSLALALLKMHRDAVTEAEMEFGPDQLDELRERLLNKLRRLKRRDDEGEDGGE